LPRKASRISYVHSTFISEVFIYENTGQPIGTVNSTGKGNARRDYHSASFLNFANLSEVSRAIDENS
jgi:hypothetical protein